MSMTRADVAVVRWLALRASMGVCVREGGGAMLQIQFGDLHKHQPGNHTARLNHKAKHKPSRLNS